MAVLFYLVLDNIKIKTGISNLGQDRICISNNPWWDVKNRPLGFFTVDDLQQHL